MAVHGDMAVTGWRGAGEPPKLPLNSAFPPGELWQALLAESHTELTFFKGLNKIHTTYNTLFPFRLNDLIL